MNEQILHLHYPSYGLLPPILTPECLCIYETGFICLFVFLLGLVSYFITDFVVVFINYVAPFFKPTILPPLLFYFYIINNNHRCHFVTI